MGDRIPLGPETDLRVEWMDPDEALVLHVRMHPVTGRNVDSVDIGARLWFDRTWSFPLRSGTDSTRVLVRTGVEWSNVSGLLTQPVVEPVWFLMNRRCCWGFEAEPKAPATLTLGRHAPNARLGNLGTCELAA